MKSVLGTILDPAADKALMTTLTVTLAIKGLLPRMCSSFMLKMLPYLSTCFSHRVPLAVIILGRDILLSLSAFYIRYKSLPAPVSLSYCGGSHRIYAGLKRFHLRKPLRAIGISVSLQQRSALPQSVRYCRWFHHIRISQNPNCTLLVDKYCITAAINDMHDREPLAAFRRTITASRISVSAS